MKNIQNNSAGNKHHLKAAEWLLARKDAAWSEADEITFLAWCGDDNNFSAYQELLETWDTLGELADAEPEALVLSPRKNMGFTGEYKKWLASAAAVAAAILLAVASQFLLHDDVRPITLQTTVGQQKTHHLQDGSTIVLNTNTKLEFLYDEQVRSITLDKGEALFIVVKNPERPFVVTAGMTATQAVGTQFSIYRKPDGDIRIAVVEGVVKVTEPEGNGGDNGLLVPRLIKDELLTVKPHLASYEKETANLSNLLSWRTGVLDFHETPLERVISEVNRYGLKKIIIMDDRIKSLKISGVFKIDDLDTFIYTIENILPVKVIETEHNEVFLRHKNAID